MKDIDVIIVTSPVGILAKEVTLEKVPLGVANAVSYNEMKDILKIYHWDTSDQAEFLP